MPKDIKAMIELVISVNSLWAEVFKNSLNAAKRQESGKTSTMVNVRAAWFVSISGLHYIAVYLQYVDQSSSIGVYPLGLIEDDKQNSARKGVAAILSLSSVNFVPLGNSRMLCY